MALHKALDTPALADANCGLLSLTSSGTVNWPRTLRLARQSAADGVRRAVSTVTIRSSEMVCRRTRQLSELLRQHSVPLTVSPAVESPLKEDLFDQVIHNSMVIGGVHRRYVLLRLRRDESMPLLPVVESVKRMNLTTVLVAPERCDRFRSRPVELRQLARQGCQFQLSASSLLDQTNPSRVSFCRYLIRLGLCHFVATESGRHHDLPVSLKEARELVARWAGAPLATAVCCDNPARLFDGQPIDPLPRASSRLRLFTGRSAAA